MTKTEAIREACSIVALAYRSIGDYSKPSDGFCDDCAKLQEGFTSWQNDGHVLAYVRAAVVAKLRADGHQIHEGFDPETGEELP